MKINVQNSSGKVVDTINIKDEIFNVKPNLSMVRQAVLAEMANLRQGTHSSKNRSAVRGGGKKPWKQKGRGVARAGTIRSPLWKGGGVVFGPTPHSYNHKIPKKMSRYARKSVLSQKIKDSEVIVLDNIEVKSKKTSDFISFLSNLNIQNKKTLILTSSFQENLILSSRNVRNAYVENIKGVSVYDLLDSEVILIDKNGVNIFTEVLS